MKYRDWLLKVLNHPESLVSFVFMRIEVHQYLFFTSKELRKMVRKKGTMANTSTRFIGWKRKNQKTFYRHMLDLSFCVLCFYWKVHGVIDYLKEEFDFLGGAQNPYEIFDGEVKHANRVNNLKTNFKTAWNLWNS